MKDLLLLFFRVIVLAAVAILVLGSRSSSTLT